VLSEEGMNTSEIVVDGVVVGKKLKTKISLRR
jgi:hypothetical protein